MNEEWRNIPGFEGLYEVSNLGRVRSVSRVFSRLSRYGIRVNQPLHGRVLRPMVTGTHLRVGLHIDDKQAQYSIHVLVAMAFIPGWEKRLHVHHKDGNGTNNAPDNLECMEPGDHARLHLEGEGAHKAKLCESDIYAIRELLAEGVRQVDIARTFSVHKTTIRDIKQGKTWKHLPLSPTLRYALNAIRTGVKKPPYKEGEGRVEGEGAA